MPLVADLAAANKWRLHWLHKSGVGAMWGNVRDSSIVVGSNRGEGRGFPLHEQCYRHGVQKVGLPEPTGTSAAKSRPLTLTSKTTSPDRTRYWANPLP